MKAWSKSTIGQSADILVGFAFKSAEFSTDDTGIRLLRGVNIDQGVLDWSTAARWSGKYDNRYELQRGDVVLAMDRPWIEAGLKRSRMRAVDLPCLLVQRVARLRGGATVKTSFLHHLVATENFSRFIQQVATGATVPHISQAQIASYEFAVPGLTEQLAICRFLDALDDLIENNRHRIGLLEQMAQAIYREWFVKFRYPGHEHATFVDSRLGPIPSDWSASSVGQVASSVVRGVAPKYSADGE